MLLGDTVPKVEISFGEIADKWTILQIKSARLSGESQILNVEREKSGLQPIADQLLQVPAALEQLELLLKTNKLIWDQMDEIYQLKETGPRYAQLSLEITIENQRRAFLKREIDILMNSDFHEEKSYFSNPGQVVVEGD